MPSVPPSSLSPTRDAGRPTRLQAASVVRLALVGALVWPLLTWLCDGSPGAWLLERAPAWGLAIVIPSLVLYIAASTLTTAAECRQSVSLRCRLAAWVIDVVGLAVVVAWSLGAADALWLALSTSAWAVAGVAPLMVWDLLLVHMLLALSDETTLARRRARTCRHAGAAA